jgi:hypothetical protein
MKYLKYFESDISWGEALDFSQQKLKEKLEAIDRFGRYIGNYDSTRLSGDMSLAQLEQLKETDVLTNSDLKQFWLTKLRSIFGIKLGTTWVSKHTIENFIKEFHRMTDSSNAIKFRNGRSKEKIQKFIDEMYEVSKSEKHDISNIKLVKELLFALEDEDMINNVKIQPTYFENIRDGKKMVPIFLISYYRNKEPQPHKDKRSVSDIWQSKFDRLLNQFKKKLPYYGLEFINNKYGVIKLAQTGNIKDLPKLS